jgi:hypothetical protein
MYNRAIRDERYINDMKKFIEVHYGFSITDISMAKRGFFGETWRIHSHDHAYFIKIDFSSHKAIFLNSLPVVDYLNSKGIDFISKIIKSQDKMLYKMFHGGVFCLFEWAEGENTEDYDIGQLFEKLVTIYRIPGNDIYIQKEDFSSSGIQSFYMNLKRLKSFTDKTALDYQKILLEKEIVITRRANRLVTFASMCRGNESQFFITHGDAGGNAILNDNQFIIVDWDQPMLAPIERDAWFFMADAASIDKIQSILNKNGIEYQLTQERLAFYAYFSFFYYLQEYFTAFFEAGKGIREELIDNIYSFFNGWIEKSIGMADGYNG